jgi:hypothetical protein
MFQIEDAEKIKTHISCSITFFFYEMMWKHTVELDGPQMTIWLMRIACGAFKTTHTHTHTHKEYVILIAFPL